MNLILIYLYHYLLQVEKFVPVDILPGDIAFEWALPSNQQNGIIRKFTITYGLEVCSMFFSLKSLKEDTLWHWKH